MIAIYIDADACPVKQEIYRVAERHALKGVALKVFVVSNAPIAVPRDEMIERVVVGGGMDEADNWIAERARAGDIVITADVPLASRCVKAGAEAIAPNGRAFTTDSIGMTLATRNLMDLLRSAGEITSGPKPFSPRDRSSFLSALDAAIVRLTRAGFGRTAFKQAKNQVRGLRCRQKHTARKVLIHRHKSKPFDFGAAMTITAAHLAHFRDVYR